MRLVAHCLAAPGVALLPEWLGGGAGDDRCAVLDWAEWGLASLTGDPGGLPTAPTTAPVAARIRALVDPGLDPGHLLAGRAALHGFTRGGRTSPNGTCRLLPAGDGWLAVNLSRPSDVELLPAALERELPDDPWASLTEAARTRKAADLADRLQLLGIPAAVLGSAAALPPVRVTTHGPPQKTRESPRVLDLSAMWAGPLCAHLLGRAGATVTKVEDVRRPDGARFGPPAFYAELHAGHREVTTDFRDPTELLALADEADVVLESSRPRALRALGLVAEDWLADRPGRTWISITGYGRDDPAARVAFGDDAAVAGGLVAGSPAGPVFAGDAIADPLTGLAAARVGLWSVRAGGGHLVDVAMAGVCAAVARPDDAPAHPHEIRRTADGWVISHGDRGVTVPA